MDDKNYITLLGIKIKQLRKMMNKTQDAFCNEIGLEVLNLSNIENGKSYTSIQTVINILNTYSVAPNDFFNFLSWDKIPKDEIIFEIEEYLKSIPDELKIHIKEILKKLSD